MEVLVAGEALRNQLRADDGAVVELDEASGSLVGEDQGGDAGDKQRIGQAQQDGGHDGEED